MVESTWDGFQVCHGTLKMVNKESLIKRFFFKTIVWADFRKNNKGRGRWYLRARCRELLSTGPQRAGAGGSRTVRNSSLDMGNQSKPIQATEKIS